LKEENFSSAALASFRAMASQLSRFKENRIIRNNDEKITPKTKLEGLDLFFWYLSQNLSVMSSPNSI
jgi:hypothetical protein